MTQHFNTLIIGGGPAGSACGIALNRKGLQSCIVEKFTFPRVKLCAGLFTRKGQDCLRQLLGDDTYAAALDASLMARESIFALHRGMDEFVSCDLSLPDNQPKSVRGTDCRIMLVSRPKLDEFLARHYAASGGTLLEGDALDTIDFDAKIATLCSGRQISYDNLVAADGAVSRIANLLAKHDSRFPYKPENGLCLEINVDRNDLDINGVRIYFDIVPRLYAWVFSKGEKVCIGLGKHPATDIDAVATMRQFCRDLGVRNMDKYPIRGAMLPFGVVMQKPVWGKHLFFVGDAAGLVTPPTGEGIYFALQSGVYAAEAIAAASPASYSKSLNLLRRIIRQGHKYQELTESPERMQYIYANAPAKYRFFAHFYLSQIEQPSLLPFWQVALKYKLDKL